MPMSLNIKLNIKYKKNYSEIKVVKTVKNKIQCDDVIFSGSETGNTMVGSEIYLM